MAFEWQNACEEKKRDKKNVENCGATQNTNTLESHLHFSKVLLFFICN